MDDVHEPPRDEDASAGVGDESGVDGLYGLPVQEFVAARNEVARSLAAAGRREAAAEVKGLRRPTLAAWAVNQVVRSQPAAWARVEAAGTVVQRAQRRALAGIVDNGLRAAAIERRQAVEAAIEAASWILVEAGASPTSHLDDVAATFEAASASADVAAVVAQARLASPITVSGGFEGALALAVVPSVASEAQATTDGDDPDGVDAARAARRREAIRVLEDARRRVEDSAAAARVAADQVDVATERAAEARRDAERAQAAAATAAARAEALEAAEAATTQAAEAARQEAATAARTAAAAQVALDDLA